MLYQLLSNPTSHKKGNHSFARKGLTNIFENENDWVLEILAPSYHKSDFTMKIEDNTLRISTPEKTEERKFFRKEFSASQIDRSFKLPKNINADNITANLEAGILSIVIPKSEAAKPRSINIK